MPDYSMIRKLILLLILFALAIAFAVIVARAQPSYRGPYAVTLAWNPSPGTNVITNYTVWWGVTNRVYTNSVSTGTFTNATVTNLAQGPIYHYAATATDKLGLTSDYSKEAEYGRPAPPNSPTELTITGSAP